jgi:hypothetical protein
MTEEQWKKTFESFEGTDAIGVVICAIVSQEENKVGLQHVINLPSLGAGMKEADALASYTELQRAIIAGVTEGLKTQMVDRIREIFESAKKPEESAGEVAAE